MIQRILNGSMLPVTVFFLFLALVSVILHSVYQDRVLGNLPEIYEKRAESRIAFECADVADEGIAYCRNEVSELEARRLQEHLGLYTQQSIAASTFGMLLASAAAVFLTLIGVYLLKETLRQTVAANEAAQEAVRVTREVGEAQVRAYLSVGFLSVKIEQMDLDSIHLLFSYSVKNTGLSPANNVAVKIDIHGQPKTGYAIGLGSVSANTSLDNQRFMMSFPIKDVLPRADAEMLPLLLELKVTANDVFNNKIQMIYEYTGSMPTIQGSTTSLSPLNTPIVYATWKRG